MKRKNCWEVMLCGCEPGGKNAEHGICPASEAGEFEGTNRGKHRGRCCWFVAGTCCNGEVQGKYAKKLMSCINCRFFIQVHEEEGRAFILSPSSLTDESHLYR